MELLGFGEYFVLFIGPAIPPLLVLLWFFLHAARRGDRSGEKR